METLELFELKLRFAALPFIHPVSSHTHAKAGYITLLLQASAPAMEMHINGAAAVAISINGNAIFDRQLS
jgi:hypothetical protein